MANFFWGPAGQAMTPEDVQRERQIAQSLIGAGADTSPVGHWTQGMSRVVQALLGNARNARADESERLGIERGTAAFGDALSQLTAPPVGVGPDGQAAPPSPPDVGAISSAIADPFMSPSQQRILSSLLGDRLARDAEAQDPLRQLQIQRAQAEIDAMQAPSAPEYMNLGNGVVFNPATGEFISAPVGAGFGNEQTAAEQKIARVGQALMDQGIASDPASARTLAVNVVDGIYTVSRDPVTQQAVILNAATGQPVTGRLQQPAQIAPGPSGSPGTNPQDVRNSFGIPGTAASALNTAADVVGAPVPFPGVQRTQANFDVLRESIISDVSEGYDRQPPSWLLKEIRSLVPATGSPLQGASGAMDKLTALRTHFDNEINVASGALNRPLSPDNKHKMEMRLLGLQDARARIQNVMGSFGEQPVSPQSTGAQNRTSSGVTWREVN